MTLLELLVKELPKRGGWPEGADEAYWHKHDNKPSFYTCPGGCVPDMDYLLYADISLDKCNFDPQNRTVTQSQYEAALAASQQQVWDGVGLPEVGCVCEARHLTEWSKVRIEFITSVHVVLSVLFSDGSEDELVWEVAHCEFRPVRTEAERKREEVINSLQVNVIHADNLTAESLYSIIESGKIAGVKLEK